MVFIFKCTYLKSGELFCFLTSISKILLKNVAIYPRDLLENSQTRLKNQLLLVHPEHLQKRILQNVIFDCVLTEKPGKPVRHVTKHLICEVYLVILADR